MLLGSVGSVGSVTGGDHPYHYLGSAIWFTRIGHAMGESMLELLAVSK